MLITPEYVAQVTGADVTDLNRVLLLIAEATEVVYAYLRRPIPSERPPAIIRIAIASVVANSLSAAEAGNVRAEQIGDYRIEFGQASGAVGFDLRPVAHILDRYRGTAVNARTPVNYE